MQTEGLVEEASAEALPGSRACPEGSKAGVGVPLREIWGLLPDGGKIATEQVTLTDGR